MTKLLPDQIVTQVKQVFAGQLSQPVEVLLFTRQEDCEACEDTRRLLEEVTELSEKLSLQVFDIDEHAELARQLHVDKTPGIVLAAADNGQRTDYGVVFAGVPSGYEFSTLVNDLILVSGRDSRLQPQTRAFLQELKQPLLLQVFTTPT